MNCRLPEFTKTLDFQKSRILDPWTFGFPGLWNSGNLYFETAGHPDDRKYGYPFFCIVEFSKSWWLEIWISWILEIPIPKFLGIWKSDFPEIWMSRFRKIWIFTFLETRISKVQIPENLDTQDSGNLEVWISRKLEIQLPENLYINFSVMSNVRTSGDWISGSLEFWKSRSPKIWIPTSLRIWKSEFAEIWKSGCRKSWIPIFFGKSNFQTSCVRTSRDPEFWKPRSLNIGIFKFLEFWKSEFPERWQSRWPKKGISIFLQCRMFENVVIGHLDLQSSGNPGPRTFEFQSFWESGNLISNLQSLKTRENWQPSSLRNLKHQNLRLHKPSSLRIVTYPKP